MRCDFPHIELFDETGSNPDYRRRRLVKSIESSLRASRLQEIDGLSGDSACCLCHEWCEAANTANQYEFLFRR